jgi:hypothetical protein
MEDLILSLDAGSVRSYFGFGETWSDLSGNRNNATLENGPIYDGQNKGSFSFDGQNDYALVPISIDANPITISVWFNCASPYGKFGLIGNVNKGFGLDGQTIYVNIGNSFENAKSYISTNSWHSVTLVYSDTSTKLYLDGNLSWTGEASSIVSNSEEVDIGKFNYVGEDRFFRGNIAKVEIYSKDLTASEIQQNFNALRGRFGI